MKLFTSLGVLILIVFAATSFPLKASDQDTIGKLIQQLGAESFVEREQAAAKLRSLGKAALPALREAARSSNLEITTRARRILASIETPQKRAMRNLLEEFIKSSRLSDRQCVQAFYLVCLGRSPTEAEFGAAGKQIIQARNKPEAVEACCDEFIYHSHFNTDLGRVNLHVHDIGKEMRRALANPVSTPAGGVTTPDDKLLRREMYAAADVLARMKKPLAVQELVDVLLLMSMFRFADEKEQVAATKWATKGKDGLADILWALVNCKEYLSRNKELIKRRR